MCSGSEDTGNANVIDITERLSQAGTDQDYTATVQRAVKYLLAEFEVWLTDLSPAELESVFDSVAEFYGLGLSTVVRLYTEDRLTFLLLTQGTYGSEGFM